MRFEFLAVFGHYSGVENDGEQASEKLIINLYPLAVHENVVVLRIVRVPQFEPSQGKVE